jgi:hypothetical protein
MSESPEMTFGQGYKPTVNESETITAAQPVGAVRGPTNGFPLHPARGLERS